MQTLNRKTKPANDSVNRQKIRALMQEKGIRPADVMRLFKCSRGAASNYLNKNRAFKTNQLLLLARLLDSSVDELMETPN